MPPLPSRRANVVLDEHQDTQCPAKPTPRRWKRSTLKSGRIAYLAFDVNLIVALKVAGSAVKESAHGMDRQDWLEGHLVIVPHVVGDVSFHLPVRFIYSPLYLMAGAIASLGSLVGLQKNSRSTSASESQ
ncbi:MAG: hypothetical protein QM813_12385 [Verrucomicrobiota bacterium]